MNHELGDNSQAENAHRQISVAELMEQLHVYVRLSSSRPVSDLVAYYMHSTKHVCCVCSKQQFLHRRGVGWCLCGP